MNKIDIVKIDYWWYVSFENICLYGQGYISKEAAKLSENYKFLKELFDE